MQWGAMTFFRTCFIVKKGFQLFVVIGPVNDYEAICLVTFITTRVAYFFSWLTAFLSVVVAFWCAQCERDSVDLLRTGFDSSDG